jgi:hypothetical protein
MIILPYLKACRCKQHYIIAVARADIFLLIEREEEAGFSLSRASIF